MIFFFVFNAMSQRLVESITNSSNIIYQLVGVFYVLNALLGILGALARVASQGRIAVVIRFADTVIVPYCHDCSLQIKQKLGEVTYPRSFN